MEQTVTNLTVFFEDPFWVCVYERTGDGLYEVCKITFGAEPKDYEVYEFLLKNHHCLRFSPALQAAAAERQRVSPKRMQRQIERQLQSSGVGTKAQQALKLQQEQGKLERRARTRAQRDAEKQRQFDLHQQKRKEKHKGH